MKRSRQLRSFVLPITVAGIIPFFLVANFDPFSLHIFLPFPYLQLPVGMFLVCLGLVLLATTIRMFARIGQGTLAPWDPTRQLVTQGVYAHTRNPMISGVLFILIGEAILFGSRSIGAWGIIFFLINTAYFKLFEEPGLVQRFGQEYLTYRANVPIWLPRLRPWRPDGEEG